MNAKTKAKPIDATSRYELSRVVETTEDRKIASEIGCCVQTLSRILAGLPVYGPTHAAVRAYLERRKLAA
jgi:hypothetical protein